MIAGASVLLAPKDTYSILPVSLTGTRNMRIKEKSDVNDMGQSRRNNTTAQSAYEKIFGAPFKRNLANSTIMMTILAVIDILVTARKMV